MGLKYTSTLRAKIMERVKETPREVAGALYVEGGVEMTESKRRCPVSPNESRVPPGHAHGYLRSTGHVALPEITPAGVTVELIYTASYAIYVHEDLEAHHTTGQAKYLESVLQESSPFMLERIATRLNIIT